MCERYPIRLMPLVSVLAFNLAISASGDTVSKFRSKTISAGFVLAFSSTSLPSFTNSSARPFRLAASLNFTEKNRSLTTASTRLGSCFCIDVCFSKDSRLSLNRRGKGTFEFYHDSRSVRGELLVERVVGRILVRPVFQIQAHPPACAHQIVRVAKQICQAAGTARPVRIVVQCGLALRFHAGKNPLRR